MEWKEALIYKGNISKGDAGWCEFGSQFRQLEKCSVDNTHFENLDIYLSLTSRNCLEHRAQDDTFRAIWKEHRLPLPLSLSIYINYIYVGAGLGLFFVISDFPDNPSEALVTFRNTLASLRWGVVSPRPIPKLEDHLLSHVQYNRSYLTYLYVFLNSTYDRKLKNSFCLLKLSRKSINCLKLY